MGDARFTVLKSGKEYQISVQPQKSLLDILIEHSFAVPQNCGGNGACGRCLVKTNGEFVLACQTFPEGDSTVVLDSFEFDSRIKSIPDADLPDISLKKLQEKVPQKGLGIGIDLGSTQIRCTIWDLALKKRIAAKTTLNPLLVYGTDILSRIVKASNDKNIAKKMQILCCKTIRDCIQSFIDENNLVLNQIAKTVLVGNTANIALLTQHNFHKLLEPEYWMRKVDCTSTDTNEIKGHLDLPPQSKLIIIPPIAGFVGSDLTAAAVFTNMVKYGKSLLIDFGTNSEIALWANEQLYVTSAAGGPAFDGCGISCGMPAIDGAIYSAKLTGPSNFEFQTIGNSNALGICGSGLVDAIAELKKSGSLHISGRFNKDLKRNQACISKEYNIFINTKDVDQLQQAKAAIASGISILCSESKVNFNELEKIFICGAFGQFLNLKNSIEIGLLPTVEESKFKIIGQAALGGCELHLLNSDHHGMINSILYQKAKIFNLASSAQFEHCFPQNLLLQPISNKGSFHV